MLQWGGGRSWMVKRSHRRPPLCGELCSRAVPPRGKGPSLDSHPPYGQHTSHWMQQALGLGCDLGPGGFLGLRVIPREGLGNECLRPEGGIRVAHHSFQHTPLWPPSLGTLARDTSGFGVENQPQFQHSCQPTPAGTRV